MTRCAKSASTDPGVDIRAVAHVSMTGALMAAAMASYDPSCGLPTMGYCRAIRQRHGPSRSAWGSAPGCSP